jgi:hypothetical protein
MRMERFQPRFGYTFSRWRHYNREELSVAQDSPAELPLLASHLIAGTPSKTVIQQGFTSPFLPPFGVVSDPN